MYFSTVATIRGGSLSAAKEVIPLPIMAGESWTPKIWSNQCWEVGKPTTKMIPRQCQGLHPGKLPAELPRKNDFCWQRWGDFFCCCPASTTWGGFILLGPQLSKVIHPRQISEINSQHPKRMASFQGLCLFDFECNMWFLDCSIAQKGKQPFEEIPLSLKKVPGPRQILMKLSIISPPAI